MAIFADYTHISQTISETEIQVLFNESLDENSIQNANFLINNGIGNPASSELDINDKSIVQYANDRTN